MITKKLAVLPALQPSEPPFPKVMEVKAEYVMSSYRNLNETLAQKHPLIPNWQNINGGDPHKIEKFIAQMTFLDEELHRRFRQAALAENIRDRVHHRHAWNQFWGDHWDRIQEEIWLYLHDNRLKHIQEKQRVHILAERAKNVVAWLERRKFTELHCEEYDAVKLEVMRYFDALVEKQYTEELRLRHEFNLSQTNARQLPNINKRPALEPMKNISLEAPIEQKNLVQSMQAQATKTYQQVLTAHPTANIPTPPLQEAVASPPPPVRIVKPT